MSLVVGTSHTIQTAVAAIVFAGTFLAGYRIYPARVFLHGPRRLISFGAGMSTAYVFVYVMPELDGARRAFVASASVPLQFEGKAIYIVALIGFLAFYGLDHLRANLRQSSQTEQIGPDFKVAVGGFAAYIWVMAYLLVVSLESTPMSILLYTIAITFHFLGIDHALQREHGVAYERIGRFVLAGMAVFGWGMGLLVALPRPVVALLVAFISGAVIVNSAIMELPTEKDGRFLPFVAGGIAYGLILLPLG